jgi:dienelactone hydrolase
MTFAEEMKTAGADWELVMYGRAMHGFTHDAATGQMPGVLYDADADARAFVAICEFLRRTLGGPRRSRGPAA